MTNDKKKLSLHWQLVGIEERLITFLRQRVSKWEELNNIIKLIF